MWSFTLVESKIRWMSLTLDAVENKDYRLLCGEEQLREIFAICQSILCTAEGDSHGSFVCAVLPFLDRFRGETS